jgi:kynurenine 3-monooxygenase
MSKRDPLVIVGAGLAGCVLATYLGRRGYPVEVFERHGDPRDAHVAKRPSLNITLCKRGISALERIGAQEIVLRAAAVAYGRKVHALDGTVAYQPYSNTGDALFSISRAALNDVLLSHAEAQPGVRIHFNRRCAQLDLADGVAHFEDTTTGATNAVQAERIFGADGAYSSVRQHLQKTERFNYSQQYLDQGYTTMKIPPLADGRPALDAGAIHIWPRGQRMSIGFPDREGTFNCSLLLPYRGAHSFETLRTEENVLQCFQELFPDAVGLVPGLVEQFFSRPPNSLVTIRCNPWSYEDKVLLVGDAAHAILPSYGQGANAAFEDCRILDQCIDECGGDWYAVFREFEQRRRPSLNVLADLCVEHFVELTEHVADPKFLRRREVERRLEEVYPDLYQPLYSMVSFTSRPYAEALRISRLQSAAIDEIVLIEGIERSVDRPEVRRLLSQSLRDTSAA